MPEIVVLNECPELIGVPELSDYLTAQHYQMREHFGNAWGLYWGIRPAAAAEVANKGKSLRFWECPLHLVLNATVADALGYHDAPAGQANHAEGFVFCEDAVKYGDSWTATASHEVLEMILDPLINQVSLATMGGKDVAIAYEACDPVENDEYSIGTPNGGTVKLSNFLLPGWFVSDVPTGTRFDYLGKLTKPLSLSPGGYLQYTEDLKNWKQVFGQRTPAHQHELARYSRRWRRILGHRRGVLAA